MLTNTHIHSPLWTYTHPTPMSIYEELCWPILNLTKPWLVEIRLTDWLMFSEDRNKLMNDEPIWWVRGNWMPTPNCDLFKLEIKLAITIKPYPAIHKGGAHLHMLLLITTWTRSSSSHSKLLTTSLTKAAGIGWISEPREHKEVGLMGNWRSGLRDLTLKVNKIQWFWFVLPQKKYNVG
jgi:hypothetical protein